MVRGQVVPVGRAEQQVLGHGAVVEVAGGIKKLHRIGQGRAVALVVGLADAHDLFDQILLAPFLEHRAQGETQDVGKKPDLLHHGDDFVQARPAVLAVDAVGRAPGVDRIKQVALDGALENKRVLGHHGDVVGNVRLGQRVDIEPGQGGRTAGIFEDLAQA